MAQEIRISVVEHDQYTEEVKFKIFVANDKTSSSQEFYGYADQFKEFANSLISFPQTIEDKVVFELGSEKERFTYYILLNVFATNTMGILQLK